MISILIFIFLLFVLSGLFSGSEMAYLSCNKLKLRHLSDSGDSRAKIIMNFQRDPQRFLTTILIGNNLVNVALTALGAYLCEHYFGIVDEWVIVAVLSPLIIVFAETVPKDWFRRKADDFIYRFAPFLSWSDRLFSLFTRFFIFVSNVLINAAGPAFKRSPFVTREEFRYVIEESTKKGILRQHELKMIDTILNLSSIRVEEVMVPFSRAPRISLTARLGEVKKLARETKSKFFLVYEEIPSLVVGIMYVFDILFETNDSVGLSKYLRAPLFIPQETSSEKALFLLQSKRSSYGVVINADREVIGIVGIDNLVRL